MTTEDWLDATVGIRRRYAGRGGEQFVCDCPICGKAKKLYVRADDGRWICYYCRDSGGGGQGGLPALIALVDEIPLAEARRRVRDGRRRHRRPGAEREEEASPAEPQASPVEPFPEGAVPVYQPGVGWTYPGYLRDRGIRARTASRYGLLAAPGWIVLPVIHHGELIGWQRRRTTPGHPKYLTARTRPEALFGHDMAVLADRVALVEGPFDVLALAQIGICAVAPLGKALSLAQGLALRGLAAREATVLLDGDAAGRRAAPGAARLLRRVGLVVTVGVMPAGADPGADPSAARRALDAADAGGSPLRARLEALLPRDSS